MTCKWEGKVIEEIILRLCVPFAIKLIIKMSFFSVSELCEAVCMCIYVCVHVRLCVCEDILNVIQNDCEKW